jgi:hypothetical protein
MVNNCLKKLKQFFKENALTKFSFLQHSNKFPLILALSFFILAFIGILHHEMWGDELQPWMIARDSSFANLATNIKYEGHPVLWYLCLYVLTIFTRNPFAMQVFHLLIATISIWVFAKFSPFTKLQKVIFSFGFFPFYEYAIKSREYALGILFLFVFCVLYRNRTKNYILLSGILFLLCHTSILGLLIAASLLGVLVLEFISDRTFRQNISKTSLVMMLMIFLVGVVSSVWQMIPPADSGYAVGWKLQFINFKRLGRILGFPGLAYFCSTQGWSPEQGPSWHLNSSLLFYLSALVLSLLPFLLFIHKPKILFLNIFGNLVLLSFFYLKYGGASWHHGNLYIFLIACLWLSAYYPDIKPKPAFLNKPFVFCKKYQFFLVTMVLMIHFYQGVRAYVKDYFYSYSAAKETAQFIQDQGFQDMLLVGDSFKVSPIAGYLDKKIYILRDRRFITYAIWDKRYLLPVKNPRETLLLQKNKFLLIVNNRLKAPPGCMIKVKAFTKSFVLDERYYLYLSNF